MAIEFVRAHGGSTIDENLADFIQCDLLDDVPAGNVLVFCWVTPNTGTVSPSVDSVEIPLGEVNDWNAVSFPSSTFVSGDGCVGGLAIIETTQVWSNSEAIRLTLSASVNRQIGLILEFSGVDFTTLSFADASTSNGSPAPSVSPTVPGSLVIGVAGWAGNSAAIQDTDTTNGSWSTGIDLGVFTFLEMLTQHKIITAGGTQTWNPVGPATHSGALLARFEPVQNGVGSATGTHAWAGEANGGPPGPDNLQAVAVSESQIDLTWDALSGYTAYDIERDGVTIVSDHATTSYSDTGLDPDTEYAYRVRGVRYA